MTEYNLTYLIENRSKIKGIEARDSIIVDIADLNNVYQYFKGPNKDGQFSAFASELGLHAESIGCQIRHIFSEPTLNTCNDENHRTITVTAKCYHALYFLDI